MDQLLRYGALDTLGFALQLLIVGFLLRALALWLEARDPDKSSPVARAIAFIY